jgi:hypothetical protein
VLASAPEESVSIFVARSGAKKLRVPTSLLVVHVSADAGFLEVGAVSAVLRRLRLRTSLMGSPSVGFSASVAVVVLPAVVLAFKSQKGLKLFQSNCIRPTERTERRLAGESLE